MNDTAFASERRRQSTFDVRILRQQRPGEISYWETFRLKYERSLNVTSVLQKIAAHPETASRNPVSPVAYEANCLEEVCGACTMLINGRTRQACTALVDKLLTDNPVEIEVRPLSKFPVIRDLVVDRQRLFRALEKVKAWNVVDTYGDRGPAPRQSQQAQERAYPLSKCMSCGCCLEACPQYGKIELKQMWDESAAAFAKRTQAAYDQEFIGAHAQNEVVLHNSNPTGSYQAAERLEAATAVGGIQNCGKAGNCQVVCPQKIPLMASWARVGRAATLHVLKKWFDG
jgi:succinate dehydrogenase / fumarate reductase iron-sulfur subunit